MRLKLFLLIPLLFFIATANAQIIYPQGGLLATLIYNISIKELPEHGFLPGKKFPTYNAINKYNFEGKKVKVLLYDDRDSLSLKKINCTEVALTNQTEFTKEQGIAKVWLYINKLFKDANLIIDSSANGSREIGFGKITVHGLCQVSVIQNGITALYCTDLADGDKTAPLRKSSFATRKTAMRLMVSAAIRDTIEKILTDLSNRQKA
ncbi:MAG TPA: hypothetical protein VF421_07420 [Niabella sp.]